VIGVDLFDYDAADVVCDLAALPFADGSIDACVSRSVLEHVPDPPTVMEQCHRVTRSGGWASRAPGWLVTAPLAVFLFPPLLILIGIPTATVLFAQQMMMRSPRLQAIARHIVTWWAIRFAWGTVALLGVVQLAQDALALS